MRKIFKIAGTELATMFYSPIAWLLLVVFAFQAAMAYTNLYGLLIFQLSMNNSGNASLIRILFSGGGGVFEVVRNSLYLYIPLLTMGLISKEFSSGSVKLLYSSPLTNLQIVLGKYLSVMVYGLCLIGVLLVLVLVSTFTMPQADVSAVIPGLIGIYLLILGYAAIGLFMSSLTSYQIIAAVGTLGVLTVLNYMRGVGNDIPFVQDITWWLSMSGRIDDFILGLLSSGDVFYYLLVAFLFLALSVKRLQFSREKQGWGKMMGSYAGICMLVVVLGYMTSRPALNLYWDGTSNEVLTISDNSRQILHRLNGPLTITTYVNLLDENFTEGMPAKKNADAEHFENYRRFKSRIDMKYVYYYHETEQNRAAGDEAGLAPEERAKKIAKDHNLNFKRVLTPQEIDRMIDLEAEGYRFVRVVETKDGQKTFLRLFNDGNKFPQEQETSAALKRLVLGTPPCVGVIYGHGERAIDKKGDRDYSTLMTNRSFRYALINQGFDVMKISLSEEVPEQVSILVLADLQSPLTSEEKEKLEAYLSRGGNLLIAGEPERREVMESLTASLGVRILPGPLMQGNEDYEPDLVFCRVTKEMAGIAPRMRGLYRNRRIITMSGTSALVCDTLHGFKVVPMLTTFPEVFRNEQETRRLSEEQPECRTGNGETQGTFVTAAELSRQVKGKEQRVIVLADADCLSNSELTVSRPKVNAYNYNFILEIFRRLSNGLFPCTPRNMASMDNSSVLTAYSMQWVTAGLLFGFPLLLALTGIIVWGERKRR